MCCPEITSRRRNIADFCERHGFVNFHGGTLEIGGTHVAGLGYSTPTPFDTPGEYSEEEMAARLGNSRVEAVRADLPRAAARYRSRPHRTGLHAGSRAVREFIEKHQPAYFFCGHIHEAEGAVIQMGATRAQNVGKKGFLLEL